MNLAEHARTLSYLDGPVLQAVMKGVLIGAGAVMFPAFERGIHDRWP